MRAKADDDGLMGTTVQDVRPNKSRFFLRNAHGMYEDLQKSGELSDQESLELRKAVGSALFVRSSHTFSFHFKPPSRVSFLFTHAPPLLTMLFLLFS